MSIQASVPPPPAPGGYQGKGGPREKRAEKERKFGTPLPLLLRESPLHPNHGKPSLFSLGILSPAAAVQVPNCIGVLDTASGSVWVEDAEDMRILFNRGFFGKGSLSRSDPSWRDRRVELLRGGSALAAEQVREKRRKERKQFKIDRAAAMLEAAKKAEAVLTSQKGGAETPTTIESQEMEGGSERPSSPTPSAADVLPEGTKLTPQTFLVRPTRPDQNRNRGKKGFKRRPPPAAAQAGGGAQGTQPAVSVPVPAPAPASDDEDSASEDDADELVKEMEFLQLSLQEAWFLSAGLGVLKIRDVNGDIVPPRALLRHFLTPTSPLSASPSYTPKRAEALYPDDPLLVSYAAYHHYRSLGWCVRDGVKFCVDWLLYRRGPVFSHSAFSVLTVPVYMSSGDQEVSPYGHTDWYDQRMSWKWMNTIMRVNSLVMKTVIIAYVTIPSIDSFPENTRLPGGGLDPAKFDMRSLMGRYSVREVSLMRFGPARRRD